MAGQASELHTNFDVYIKGVIPMLGILVYRLMCIALVLIAPYCMRAQFDIDRFRHYSYKDGLSDDFVYSIAQDHKGYIWIGTHNGLNRFDGNHFEKYYQDAPKDFLHSSQVTRIKMLTKDRLAVLTHNRVELLDANNYSIQSLFIPDTTSFMSLINSAWDFLELPGQGYAVTTAVGFYFYDTSGKIGFRLDAFTKEDIGIKRMLYGRNMHLLPGNQILVYIENNKQAIYDVKNKTFKFVNNSNSPFGPLCHPEKTLPLITTGRFSDHEFIIIPQDDSLIYYNISIQKRVASRSPIQWLKDLNWSSKVIPLSDSSFALTGGQTGLFVFRLNRKTGEIKGDGKKYLETYGVNNIFRDNEQRLWIATTNGLFKENLQQPFIHTFSRPVQQNPSATYPNDIYWSIMKYKDKLYAGRYDIEKGLAILDASTLELEKTVTFFPEEAGSNVIHGCQVYYEDTLWIGSDNGAYWYDINRGGYGKVADLLQLPAFNYASILMPVHDDGYAWIGGYLNGFLARYDVKKRTAQIFNANSNPPIPFYHLKHIAYDADGNVWIGGHSLARWNQASSTFDTIMSSYAGPNKFNDNILMMEADTAGNLWIVNNQNGLLQYKTRSAEWIYYGIEAGFPLVIFQSMSPVVNNEIWLSDPYHLSRFNISEGKIYSYDEADGVQIGHADNRDMYFDVETQQMHQLVQNKICRWNIHELPTENDSVNLICQEIRAKDEKSIFFPGENSNFSYHQNDLVLTYTVIDYESGPGYQFAYRIRPEESWTNIGGQRKLYLNNLSPGDYEIEFKARSISGIEKINQLRFSIQPPFWRTNWFLGFGMIVLFALGYYLYRRRIKVIKTKANIDMLLSEAEMKALHAQMNPHFIFNSLNSIRKLVLNNENYDASRYLGKFAHLIRMTLDQSRQSFISLRQTIEYLERYIELEKIRNPNFTCNIEVDEAIDQDEIHLPPMLIQPFIENAIWHGLTPEREEIDIRVKFEKQGEQLVCLIDDNGIGIETSLKNKSINGQLHRGVGIENIQSRIELLNRKHNQKSSITLVDKASLKNGNGSGTCVTLRLPIEMNEE